METELAKFKQVGDYYVFADFETSVELRFRSRDNNMVMHLINDEDFPKLTPFDIKKIINHFLYPCLQYTQKLSDDVFLHGVFERTLNTEYPVAKLSFVCKEPTPYYTYRVTVTNGKFSKYKEVISLVGCDDREGENLTATQEYRIPSLLSEAINGFFAYAQYVTGTELSFEIIPDETIKPVDTMLCTLDILDDNTLSVNRVVRFKQEYKLPVYDTSFNHDTLK